MLKGNHPLIDEASDGYLEIHDNPKAPLHRITISKNMLLHTQFAYVFFMGEAYTNFLDTDLGVHDSPIKLTQDCSNTYVFSDQLL